MNEHVLLIALELIGKHVIINDVKKTGTKNQVAGFRYTGHGIELQFNDGSWRPMSDLTSADVFEVEAD